MKLKRAELIAEHVKKLLEPGCFRVEIAGSVRRKKPEVKDIEIVAIPKPYETGLFADGIAKIVNEWPKTKGELDYHKCKYTQRILPWGGIKLDLFFATEENWGLIYAIRTGSAEFSHKVLATGWVKEGFESKNGMLTRMGVTYFVREEKDLFDLIKVPYVEPEQREL